MAQAIDIDVKKSALLLLNFQRHFLASDLEQSAANEALRNTAYLLRAARQAALPVVHVITAFSEGYPEASSHNLACRGYVNTGSLVRGDPQAEIHEMVTPLESEPVVVKHRNGAFAGTDLDSLLKARGVQTLILAGISTLTTVLPTFLQAQDHDYRTIVIMDCCADPSELTQEALFVDVFEPLADEVVGIMQAVDALLQVKSVK